MGKANAKKRSLKVKKIDRMALIICQLSPSDRKDFLLSVANKIATYYEKS